MYDVYVYKFRAANTPLNRGVTPNSESSSARSDNVENPPLFAILLYKKKSCTNFFWATCLKSENVGVSRLVTKSILQGERVTFPALLPI